MTNDVVLETNPNHALRCRIAEFLSLTRGKAANLWLARSTSYRVVALSFFPSGAMKGVCAFRQPTDRPPDDCFTASQAQYKIESFEFELIDLAVHSEARGTQVGYNLVLALTNYGRYNNIFAVTEISNTASIRIKEKIGYITVGDSFMDRKGSARLQVYAHMSETRQ